MTPPEIQKKLDVEGPRQVGGIPDELKRPGAKKVEQMRDCAEEMERWFRKEPGCRPIAKNRYRPL
jgi:hypothetical protein